MSGIAARWVSAGECPRCAPAATRCDCVSATGVGGRCSVWCGCQVELRFCVEPRSANCASAATLGSARALGAGRAKHGRRTCEPAGAPRVHLGHHLVPGLLLFALLEPQWRLSGTGPRRWPCVAESLVVCGARRAREAPGGRLGRRAPTDCSRCPHRLSLYLHRVRLCTAHAQGRTRPGEGTRERRVNRSTLARLFFPSWRQSLFRTSSATSPPPVSSCDPLGTLGSPSDDRPSRPQPFSTQPPFNMSDSDEVSRTRAPRLAGLRARTDACIACPGSPPCRRKRRRLRGRHRYAPRRLRPSPTAQQPLTVPDFFSPALPRRSTPSPIALVPPKKCTMSASSACSLGLAF